MRDKFFTTNLLVNLDGKVKSIISVDSSCPFCSHLTDGGGEPAMKQKNNRNLHLIVSDFLHYERKWVPWAVSVMANGFVRCFSFLQQNQKKEEKKTLTTLPIPAH